VNKCFSLIIVFLLLAACQAVPSGDLTATAASIASPTPAATTIPTSSPTATSSPTPEEPATPPFPGFYPGLAPTLDQFPLVDKADIPDFIEFLSAQDSLLDPDSLAPAILPVVHNASGEAYFTIECNSGGLINCAPAASFQIADQGLDVHIILWEIRNKDGSRGYLANYFYDSVQYADQNAYQRLVALPLISRDYIVITGVAGQYQAAFPYVMSLFQQDGYMQVIQEWINTGNIPQAMENMIMPMFNL
jgi:hypothetical protein